MAKAVTQSILVVGGGMSGLSAAIEAAEAGHEVYLVEKNPYLGGRVAQLHQVFSEVVSSVLRFGDQLPAPERAIQKSTFSPSPK